MEPGRASEDAAVAAAPHSRQAAHSGAGGVGAPPRTENEGVAGGSPNLSRGPVTIATEQQPCSSQAPAGGAPAPDGHFSILLVEDDCVTLKQVAQLLKKYGNYSVTTAEDGAKAMELLRRAKAEGVRRYDLVLTDLLLPEVSGFDLIHEVACGKGGDVLDVPIVVMSSQDSRDSVLRAFEAGAADYLIKPIRRNEVSTLWQHIWRNNRVRATTLMGASPEATSGVTEAGSEKHEGEQAAHGATDAEPGGAAAAAGCAPKLTAGPNDSSAASTEMSMPALGPSQAAAHDGKAEGGAAAEDVACRAGPGVGGGGAAGGTHGGAEKASGACRIGMSGHDSAHDGHEDGGPCSDDRISDEHDSHRGSGDSGAPFAALHFDMAGGKSSGDVAVAAKRSSPLADVAVMQAGRAEGANSSGVPHHAEGDAEAARSDAAPASTSEQALAGVRAAIAAASKQTASNGVNSQSLTGMTVFLPKASPTADAGKSGSSPAGTLSTAPSQPGALRAAPMDPTGPSKLSPAAVAAAAAAARVIAAGGGKFGVHQRVPSLVPEAVMQLVAALTTGQGGIGGSAAAAAAAAMLSAQLASGQVTAGLGSAAPVAAASAAAAHSLEQAGDRAASEAHRQAALAKYLEKRKNRTFQKVVRYESRKRLAESRPRVKGQFVKAAERAAMAEAAADEDGAAAADDREVGASAEAEPAATPAANAPSLEARESRLAVTHGKRLLPVSRLKEERSQEHDVAMLLAAMAGSGGVVKRQRRAGKQEQPMPPAPVASESASDENDDDDDESDGGWQDDGSEECEP